MVVVEAVLVVFLFMYDSYGGGGTGGNDGSRRIDKNIVAVIMIRVVSISAIV